jgi:hypothetical protein
MSTRRQTVGRWGEDAATDYLEANGYGVLTNNEYISVARSIVLPARTSCWSS